MISTARMCCASSSLVRRHPARLRVVSCTPRPGRTVTASHLGATSQAASASKAAAAAVHGIWLRSSAWRQHKVSATRGHIDAVCPACRSPLQQLRKWQRAARWDAAYGHACTALACGVLPYFKFCSFLRGLECTARHGKPLRALDPVHFYIAHFLF